MIHYGVPPLTMNICSTIGNLFFFLLLFLRIELSVSIVEKSRHLTSSLQRFLIKEINIVSIKNQCVGKKRCSLVRWCLKPRIREDSKYLESWGVSIILCSEAERCSTLQFRSCNFSEMRSRLLAKRCTFWWFGSSERPRRTVYRHVARITFESDFHHAIFGEAFSSCQMQCNERFHIGGATLWRGLSRDRVWPRHFIFIA